MYNVTQNGVLKSVESWCVILPLQDNQGIAFKQDLVDGILENLLLDYPGFTITNSVGYWNGSDRVYLDQNYQIIVDAVPDNSSDSSGYFVNLKKKLQKTLNQEKVYVTKQDSKQELLTFDEFFKEIGLQLNTQNTKIEAAEIAKQLASRTDFVIQRLGYATSALRRDISSKKIIWERSVSGLKIRSEFEDLVPPGVTIIAADQFSDLGRAMMNTEPVAVIGSYEFQAFILDRAKQRPLIEAKNIKSENCKNPYSASPRGEPLNAKQFVEEFVGAAFTHCLILRDEGFLPEEIKINVGKDGSMQTTVGLRNGILMHNPADIPDGEIQQEIISLLGAALTMNENNLLDPIAILQAKAKNNYFVERSIVRHSLKSID
jgi:hypothetical protein